jgi:hypothetical protein
MREGVTLPVGRRALLRAAALAAAGKLRALPKAPSGKSGAERVVLVTIGGVRRRETFSAGGLDNIPRLHGDLLPRALFFENVVNQGVTSHFNTITSILTGSWQHLDDWGRDPPRQPNLIQYLRGQLGLEPAQTFVVTSNKAVTSHVGAGGNVILSKQLLVEAVERIIMGYSRRRRLERELLLEELTEIMQQDYERIGWELASPAATLAPDLKETFLTALASFVSGPDSAISGDELTFQVASEVLRRVQPVLLVINFSDVEIAHSGVYSAHLAGIRRTDLLCFRLWNLLASLPAYRGATTLVILPEFGRDPDGSTTNGFFNHRTDTEENRVTWMLVLGRAVRQPAVIQRAIRHIDVAPSLGARLGVRCPQAAGEPVLELLEGA